MHRFIIPQLLLFFVPTSQGRQRLLHKVTKGFSSFAVSYEMFPNSHSLRQLALSLSPAQDYQHLKMHVSVRVMGASWGVNAQWSRTYVMVDRLARLGVHHVTRQSSTFVTFTQTILRFYPKSPYLGPRSLIFSYCLIFLGLFVNQPLERWS